MLQTRPKFSDSTVRKIIRHSKSGITPWHDSLKKKEFDEEKQKIQASIEEAEVCVSSLEQPLWSIRSAAFCCQHVVGVHFSLTSISRCQAVKIELKEYHKLEEEISDMRSELESKETHISDIEQRLSALDKERPQASNKRARTNSGGGSAHSSAGATASQNSAKRGRENDGSAGASDRRRQKPRGEGGSK